MLRIPAIRWGAFFRYVAVAAAISSTTGIFELLQPHVTLVNAALVYLLLVVAVGAIWGLGTAMFATVAATVAFDFAYLPPTHNLQLPPSPPNPVTASPSPRTPLSRRPR